MTHSIDIVIPSHGRQDGLPRLIDALRRELDHVRIIVVDSSAAEAAIKLEQLAEELGVTYLSGPASAGAKRNIGLRASQAEFVYFTDSDVDPNPAAVTCLAHEIADADPAVVGATGPTALVPNETVASRATLLSSSRTSAFSWPSQHAITEWATCTNLMVRRVAALEIGGFDETLPLPVYGEDVDFGIRLTSRFGPLRCVTVASVTHPSPRTVGSQIRKSFASGRMDIELQIRHPLRRILASPGALLMSSTLTAGAFATAVAGYPLVSAALAASAVLRLGMSLASIAPRSAERLSDIGAILVASLWDAAFEAGMVFQAVAIARPHLALSRFRYRDVMGRTVTRRRRRDFISLVTAIFGSTLALWMA